MKFKRTILGILTFLTFMSVSAPIPVHGAVLGRQSEPNGPGAELVLPSRTTTEPIEMTDSNGVKYKGNMKIEFPMYYSTLPVVTALHSVNAALAEEADVYYIPRLEDFPTDMKALVSKTTLTNGDTEAFAAVYDGWFDQEVVYNNIVGGAGRDEAVTEKGKKKDDESVARYQTSKKVYSKNENSRLFQTLGYDLILSEENAIIQKESGSLVATYVPKFARSSTFDKPLTTQTVVMDLYKALGEYQYDIKILFCEDTTLNLKTAPFNGMISQPINRDDSGGIDPRWGRAWIWCTRTNPKLYWDTIQKDRVFGGTKNVKTMHTYPGEAQSVTFNKTQQSDMTLGEFCAVARAMMELYGEPVMTEVEQLQMIQVYGFSLPTNLTQEQSDAVRYLAAKGIIDPTNVNFNKRVHFDDISELLLRIGDPSSRLTFKESGYNYNSILFKNGYVPATIEGVADIEDTAEETDLNNDPYYDYFVESIDGFSNFLLIENSEKGKRGDVVCDRIGIIDDNINNETTISINGIDYPIFVNEGITSEGYYHFKILKSKFDDSMNNSSKKITQSEIIDDLYNEVVQGIKKDVETGTGAEDPEDGDEDDSDGGEDSNTDEEVESNYLTCDRYYTTKSKVTLKGSEGFATDIQCVKGPSTPTCKIDEKNGKITITKMKSTGIYTFDVLRGTKHETLIIERTKHKNIDPSTGKVSSLFAYTAGSTDDHKKKNKINSVGNNVIFNNDNKDIVCYLDNASGIQLESGDTESVSVGSDSVTFAKNQPIVNVVLVMTMSDGSSRRVTFNGLPTKKPKTPKKSSQIKIGYLPSESGQVDKEGKPIYNAYSDAVLWLTPATVSGNSKKGKTDSSSQETVGGQDVSLKTIEADRKHSNYYTIEAGGGIYKLLVGTDPTTAEPVSTAEVNASDESINYYVARYNLDGQYLSAYKWDNKNCKVVKGTPESKPSRTDVMNNLRISALLKAIQLLEETNGISREEVIDKLCEGKEMPEKQRAQFDKMETTYADTYDKNNALGMCMDANYADGSRYYLSERTNAYVKSLEKIFGRTVTVYTGAEDESYYAMLDDNTSAVMFQIPRTTWDKGKFGSYKFCTVPVSEPLNELKTNGKIGARTDRYTFKSGTTEFVTEFVLQDITDAVVTIVVPGVDSVDAFRTNFKCPSSTNVHAQAAYYKIGGGGNNDVMIDAQYLTKCGLAKSVKKQKDGTIHIVTPSDINVYLQQSGSTGRVFVGDTVFLLPETEQAYITANSTFINTRALMGWSSQNVSLVDTGGKIQLLFRGNKKYYKNKIKSLEVHNMDSSHVAMNFIKAAKDDYGLLLASSNPLSNYLVVIDQTDKTYTGTWKSKDYIFWVLPNGGTEKEPLGIYSEGDASGQLSKLGLKTPSLDEGKYKLCYRTLNKATSPTTNNGNVAWIQQDVTNLDGVKSAKVIQGYAFYPPKGSTLKDIYKYMYSGNAVCPIVVHKKKYYNMLPNVFCVDSSDSSFLPFGQAPASVTKAESASSNKVATYKFDTHTWQAPSEHDNSNTIDIEKGHLTPAPVGAFSYLHGQPDVRYSKVGSSTGNSVFCGTMQATKDGNTIN